MKQTQKTILLLITLAFMIFTTGCEIYDCDAASTEITTLEQNLLASSLASITIANCTEYADKVNEYVDEGCGTHEDENTNCEELVCSIHISYMFIYGFTMAFSFDSTEYCTYYDSLGMTMQELVNAGGCASDSLLDVAITQAEVDEYISNGCDWGDSTTVNSVNPFIGELSQLDAKESIEELVNELPDVYSNIIRKRFDRIFSN